MVKTLVIFCCLLTIGGPAFADGTAAFSEAALTGNGVAGKNDATAPTAEDESAEEQSFQDLVQTVRWGGRTWTCFARSRGGRTFSGQSRNANTARRIALNRCRSRSRGCFISRCR